MSAGRNTCIDAAKTGGVSIFKQGEHVDLLNEVYWWVYIVPWWTTESINFYHNESHSPSRSAGRGLC